jgi:8-oxo-dGTP pyrophosphatase MutT (NUDIX family)
MADADPKILFIKRALHPVDPWSGHVALPGGRVEEQDNHVEDTARRETLEEVGLRLSEQNLWGALKPVQARAADGNLPMWIFPHVYRISGEPPGLTLNEREVESARWISVQSLVDPLSRQEVEFQTRGGKMKMPAWVIADFTIWGLTFFMVQRFLGPLLKQK